MKSKPAQKTITEKLYQLYNDYYNSQIFTTNGYCELTAWAELLEADPSAFTTQKTDTDTFFLELSAFNIELFGLAWVNYNYELCEEEKQDSSQGDVALCSEIMFAKSYLEQTRNGDIWSSAGFYNDAIFQAHMAQRISRDWSVPRDSGYYMREIPQSVEKEEDLLLKTMREHYDKLLSDKECSLRLSKRLVSAHTWRDGIMIPQKLSSAFAQRLNFSPNIEALLLIQRLIVGLYENARDYINAVRDYGSWELARKATDGFRQHLIRIAQTEIEKKNKSEN